MRRGRWATIGYGRIAGEDRVHGLEYAEIPFPFPYHDCRDCRDHVHGLGLCRVRGLVKRAREMLPCARSR